MDIATLGIAIDSTPIRAAADALLGLVKVSKETKEASKKTVDQLKAQAAALGMSAREAKLFEVALGGATQAQLKEADAALKAVEAHDQAASRLKSAHQFGKDIGSALKAGFTMALTAATAFIVGLDAIIQKVGDIQDIADKTGGSAVGIASLRTAADVAGVSLDKVGTNLNMMQRQLSRTSDESIGAAKGLAQMGLNIDDIRKMDPAQAYFTIAKALDTVESSSGKLAIQQDILGRGAGEQGVMLKALAEQKQIQAMLTAEEIQLADDYSDALKAQKSEIFQTMEVIAVKATPTMYAFQKAALDTITEMFGLKKAGEELRGSTAVQDWAETAARFLASTVDIAVKVVNTIRSLGLGLGSLAAAGVQLWNMDLTDQNSIAAAGRAIRNIYSEYSKDVANLMSGPTFRDNLEKQLSQIKAQGGKIKAEVENAGGAKLDRSGYTSRVPREKKEKVDRTTERELKAQEDQYESLMLRIRERLQLGEEELKGGRKLTAVEREATKVMEMLASSKGKLNPQQVESVRLAYEEAKVQETLLEQRRAHRAFMEADREAEAKRVAVLEKNVVSMAEQNQSLTEEIELIGLSEAAQLAVTDARLASVIAIKEEHLARFDNAEFMSREQIALEREIELLKERRVLQSKKVNMNIAVTNKKLVDDFLDPAKAKSFGDALKDAFGGAGSALVALTSAMKDFATQQAEVDKVRAAAIESYGAESKEVAAVNEQAMQGQIRGYGDMASAASGFFDKSSSGYKTLQGISQAFHAVDLAMTMAKLIPQGISAILTQGQGDPYSAFPRMAAMAAIVAGLGVAIAGGGGGGGGSVGPSAEALQRAQGAGSVLGDASAKSETLKNSMDLLNKDFENSRKMLRALQNIEQNIGSLANAIARQMGVAGGMFDSSNLGIGETKRWGSAVFGGNRTTTLKDRGLMFAEQTIGEAASGIRGTSYQTTHTKKEGGWFSKDKSWDTTTQGALDSEIARWLTQTVDSLRTGVVTAAGVLGLGGAEETINALKLGLSKVSMMDLTGEEITQQLEAVMGKAFDDMALAVSPGLLEFARVGEGAGETMIRLANNITVVNGTLEMLGTRLFEVGVQGAGAASKLVDKFGGLDQFSDTMNAYYEGFYTEAEKTASLTTRTARAFASLGIAMPVVDDKFKSWYRSEVSRLGAMDLSIEANAEAYVSILDLAGAVLELAPEIDQVTKAQNELNEAYDAQRSHIENVRDSMKNWIDNLKDFQSSLLQSEMSTLTPEEKYAAAATNYELVKAEAKAGNLSAVERYESVAEEFLAASRTVFASSEQYTNDFLRVLSDSEAMISVAQLQYDTAVASLEALDASVGELINIKHEVRSVQDAINRLNIANAGGTPHAAGIDFVPKDMYAATLHHGEAVLTKEENVAYRSQAELLSEVRRLTTAVETLQRSNREDASEIVAATYHASSKNAAVISDATVEAANTTAYLQKVRPVLS